MTDQVYLAAASPATGYTIRKRNKLLVVAIVFLGASDLAQKARPIVHLMLVLFMVMLVAVDGTRYLWTLRRDNAILPAHVIESYELLIQLAGSIVDASPRCDSSNVYVIIRLHVASKRKLKVFTHDVALIWSAAQEAMHEHNGVVVAPKLARQVPEPAVTKLVGQLAIKLFGNLAD